ncbi:MAG: paraquat-inducible protein A [Lamprobacter sp.]|uniref:paraquat-inducible protein A n=1 Tax=Lamprobacter sp. TaxID=3100796 RepID=UPI002B26269E|nr:paraquat-inducible protein A [Lamprobacter sp.]MEA3638651.1 paraquat-inducible protein A [Lamprobacter sp.]
MLAQLKRIIVGLIAAILLVAVSIATYQLILELRALQQTQWQRAELQDVKYGLFDAEVWVSQVSAILAERLQAFELTEQNRPQIKRNLEILLDRMLSEVEQVLRRRNAEGESWVDRLQGSLRQGVQDWLVDFDQLRARVPLYADAVLEELNRPENRREIQHQLLQAIEQAAGATFTKVDRSLPRQIEEAHGCETRADCIETLQQTATAHQAQAQRGALWALGGVSLLFILAWLDPGSRLGADQAGPRHGCDSGMGSRNRVGSGCATAAATAINPRRHSLAPETMLMLSAATLLLLAAGVMTPMIEVEARIDQLSLSLLGKPLIFTDQVLYFQSKSILDLVQVLAATGAADMILVALLVLLFSLIFPAAKILASLLYYTDLKGLRGQALVRFFTLRSGKWSMADVLVVAILMAYLGFDGLISSQFAELSGLGRQVDLLSTNGTRLQLGFFLFLAFVLASLFLSALLEARAPASSQAP